MNNEFQYMSYEQAAAELQIKLDSVRVIARRHRWPKRKGNDRKMLIGVPIERLRSTKTSPDTSTKTGVSVHELQNKILILETELKLEVEKNIFFKHQYDDLKADRDAWREQSQNLSRPWWKRLAG